ncbi:hypothetical protein FIBSPDRAFT_918248 [Athelia psychrophila]|uniref:NAD(P)-binding protein n=1 Tax=Athelia psychrophila TaxID=1759441 RepID=A0A166PHN8_9AGAM|nr:hypothetical protein FIBSPDRAFT_918248 [Fibularhizoctonia sp. CBS 109695]
MVNGRVSSGQTVLVTGAGGGVAIIAIQLCMAQSANIYITTGSADNINRAVDIGAKGGLENLLKTDGIKKIDDSAGGEQLMTLVGRVLGNGGIVVCYGMTAGKHINVTMPEVMYNRWLIAAIAFLEKHRIIPVISRVLYGLEGALEGFDIRKQVEGFGKVVVDISGTDASL